LGTFRFELVDIDAGGYRAGVLYPRNGAKAKAIISKSMVNRIFIPENRQHERRAVLTKVDLT